MIYKVEVVKDGNYYICQPKVDSNFFFKCGKCLYGNIPAINEPQEIPVFCKICGAKHYRTIYGHSYYDLKEFYSV